MNTLPEQLDLSKPRRVKFGIDPTFPALHLGHLVPLRIVKRLLNDGHDVTIVLGTFTAIMGDPSGQDKTRPFLSKSEVEDNAEKIKDIIDRLLGWPCNQPNEVTTDYIPNLRLHFNGDVFNQMTIDKFLAIASKFTVQQTLMRDSFQKRLNDNNPLGLHEILVPLCQAWDSVVLRTELEIGGNDQLVNFQVARDLQAAFGQARQSYILTPIINGLDGRKMSKSLNNCVFLTDVAVDMFGKIMSVPDNVMEEWIPLLTDGVSAEHPMDRKKALAFDVTKQVWGEKYANHAKSEFERVFQKSELPTEMPMIASRNLVDIVAQIRNCSKSEARRLIDAGAVTEFGKECLTIKSGIASGMIVQVGKRFFGKVI